MTNEEKQQLLLKDLCSRLPYGVKGVVYAEVTNGEYDLTGDMIFFDSAFDVTLDAINTSTEEIHVVAIGNEDTVEFIECQQADGKPYTIEEFKPYLRPMSSMTEEEKADLEKYSKQELDKYADAVLNHADKDTVRYAQVALMYKDIDWYTKKHFDYRGLIPMGLALPATEGMYN